jgi:hypothetical protein
MSASDEAAQGAPHIHIENKFGGAEAHGWKVLGVILAVAALVAGGYGLATAGLLELAASMIAAFLSMFLQLLFRNGVIVLPEKKSEDARIEEGKGAVKAIAGMVQAWIDRSSILRLALIAIGYAVVFILVRAGVSALLRLTANVWVAAMFGGLLAAAICAPTVFAGIVRTLKSKTNTKKEQS